MKNRKQLIEGILHSFHAIQNQIKARAFRLKDQNGTAHSQWFVLKVIGHYKSRCIKDIAETLAVSSSAATQLVDGLVKNGYVARKDHPKDRRSVRLEVSPKGKKHIIAMNERRISEMMGLFDALTDKELEKYLSLQGKIISKLSHKG